MSWAASRPDQILSREEYRRWYDAQPTGRYERVDGRIVAMAAERASHGRMKLAVAVALRRAVNESGGQCEAFVDSLAVETPDSDFEPDALVNCGPRIEPNSVVAPNPVVVVEVLSPGTAAVDTSHKLVGYFLVPSIAHYLIVAPDRRRIIHHRRTADGIATAILSAGSIELDPPGLKISVEEVYAGM